jgi:hypothetical protein
VAVAPAEEAPKPRKKRMASTSSKRKAEPKEADAGPSSKKSAAGPSLVNPKRWKVLHEGTAGDGPVIYWCVAGGAPLRQSHRFASGLESVRDCVPCELIRFSQALACQQPIGRRAALTRRRPQTFEA